VASKWQVGKLHRGLIFACLISSHPSKKSVQLHSAGRIRSFGTYESRKKAALAHKIVRENLKCKCWSFGTYWTYESWEKAALAHKIEQEYRKCIFRWTRCQPALEVLQVQESVDQQKSGLASVRKGMTEIPSALKRPTGMTSTLENTKEAEVLILPRDGVSQNSKAAIDAMNAASSE
jgi:hypothetical protein